MSERAPRRRFIQLVAPSTFAPTFLFIQNAPLLPQKKRYQIVHLFKTPLLLEKKQLLPQEAHKMTKFLYLFKAPPPR